MKSQYYSTKYSSKVVARQNKMLANMRQHSQCSQRMETQPGDDEEYKCSNCHKVKRKTKQKRRIDASPARFDHGRANSARPELKGMRERARFMNSDDENDEGMQLKKLKKRSKKSLKKLNKSPNLLKEFDQQYIDAND